MFFILCSKLVIDEKRDGMTFALSIEFDAIWQCMGRQFRVTPEFDRQSVTCEVPRRRRCQCCMPKGRQRNRKTLQHFKVLGEQAANPPRASARSLAGANACRLYRHAAIVL